MYIHVHIYIHIHSIYIYVYTCVHMMIAFISGKQVVEYPVEGVCSSSSRVYVHILCFAFSEN